MKSYRSAMGKTVDMQSIIAKNEHVRAVGNMSVNARGDEIDTQGKIVKPVTEKVNDRYAKTVGNKSANVVRRTAPVEKPHKPVIKEELTEFEKELEDSFEDDLEIEKIKAKEMKK